MNKSIFNTAVAVAGVALFCIGCSEKPDGGGDSTFTDSRDNKTYKKVTIGTQTWMGQNLNYNVSGSKCFGEGGISYIYDDETDNVIEKTLSDAEVQANCVKYGRLYTWNAARSACPAGWHLPSDAEWDALVDYAGGSETAGGKLKSTNGWYNNGTDEFGFSALPGGYGFGRDEFDRIGYNGFWWSATENISYYAWSYVMHYDYESVNKDGNGGMGMLFSVRCVQD